MGKPVDIAVLTAQIQERDELDRNRELAPLRPAPDAVLIDTSDVDIETVLARILDAAGVRERS